MSVSDNEDMDLAEDAVSTATPESEATPPVEDAPADDAPVAETPVEEAPVEEAR